MKRIFQNQKSFALIYVLLFIVLLLIAVSSTWLIGMADLRLSQRSEYSVQAMQLAKAAIDDGWLKYKSDIGTTYPLPDINYPTDACSAISKIVRVNPNVTPVTSSTTNLSPPPTLVQTVEGRYDYRICTDTSVSPHKTTIEGIGYYKGSKVTMKAEVAHGVNEGYCDPNYGTFPSCTDGINTGTPKLNHANDYITIYQSGPSK